MTDTTVKPFEPWDDEEKAWITDHAEKIEKYISFPVKINNVRLFTNMITAHRDEAAKLAADPANKRKVIVQRQYTSYINACNTMLNLIAEYGGALYQQFVDADIEEAVNAAGGVPEETTESIAGGIVSSTEGRKSDTAVA